MRRIRHRFWIADKVHGRILRLPWPEPCILRLNYAEKVFAGRTATWDDDRRDYGERRLITAGYLGARMVVMVWTRRGAARHIISMRFAHDKEIKKVTALYKSLA